MAVKEMAIIWCDAYGLCLVGRYLNSEANFCFWLELVMAYVDQAS
ncbi:hypothetical protein Patl1_09327 [Pistacia atlantica]|uniref:Uncharacterized protein n=1 Tax=Pistacia atlantica TaxID=434234 RepID=A0ACC1AJI0_9ROSI|nr:hypothetical protein Patl1_09327 [Pistacia atlantica]